MAIAKWMGPALAKALNKEVDFNEADKIKIMLLSAYTFDQDAHEYLDDVLAAGTEVANGNGYSNYANGNKILTNCAVTYTGATNVVKLDADDASWTASTITASYAVVYYAGPTDQTDSPVLFYIDFEGAKSSSNGTFSIVWNSSGIGTITVA